VKKISFGAIDGIANYLGTVTGSGGFLRVHWTSGVTEGGSSGSALITGSYPNDRFVGTLKGGFSLCSLPTGGDWYGRFDLVYPSIRAYLSPAPPPPAAPKLTSFSANVAFPVALNIPITFTATATGGPAPLQYKFVVFSPAKGWLVGRDYSSVNTFTWYPPEGQNVVQVLVRAAGSTASYQDWMGTDYFTVGMTMAHSTALPALSPSTRISLTALGSDSVLDHMLALRPQFQGWSVPREWPEHGALDW